MVIDFAIFIHGYTWGYPRVNGGLKACQWQRKSMPPLDCDVRNIFVI